jgi:2-alkyl-3-oxoalkanoate reductase
MNVLVTGATGVIGRRAVPLLVAAGHNVTALGRSAERRTALERAGAKTANIDLFDRAALKEALSGQEAVINLATHIPALSWQMMLHRAWAENDRLRREASAKLVDAAIEAGARRFVQESFAPVYADRRDAWIDESVAIAPTRNTQTVADAERSAARFTSSGRSGVVLRFAAFYGPDATHVKELVRFARRPDWLRWAPLPGAPDAFMSSVSHDDAAAAVVAALDLTPGVYNVTDDEPLTHRAYIDAFADALGVPPLKLPPTWATFLFGAPGELLARSHRISNYRLRNASRWSPRFRSAREGWRDALGTVSRGAPVRAEHATAN